MLVAPGVLALAACGGGGASPTPTPTSAPTPTPTTAALQPADAARLAKQATFGATQPVIDRMVQLGVDGWITEQFSQAQSSYADLAALAVPRDYCSSTGAGAAEVGCSRRYFSREQVAMRFYADAIANQDQLRQRVAFALSQLLVASDVEVSVTAGLASFNQIFLANAFGNFRDILKQVALHPYMGDYLDMADSSKSAPNENFAREFLQLFSMGPDQLNMDGSFKRDGTGAILANYTPDDIKAVARALTGWTYARLNNGAANDYNLRDYTKPMVQVAARYDTTEKLFLGTTVAAGATQDQSVDAVVDAAFNNASTPPRIAKFLIQNLVTSNPSAAYVQRVANIFVNNGQNVRGDMKAVIRAILTDPEARGVARSGATDGKVKEPVLLLTGIMRAVGFVTDGYAFTTRDTGMGQALFRAPSVFNYYPPDFPLPQNDVLLSPPSKLMTTGSALARHNLIYDWTISGDQSRGEFGVQTQVYGSTGSRTDWSGWEAFGTDTDAMIDRIDLLLLNKTMTATQRDRLKTAVLAITNADPALQARKRAQLALYIVGSSPLFQVDR
jgi:uncharacterized protein (DUF1800 family)